MRERPHQSPVFWSSYAPIVCVLTLLLSAPASVCALDIGQFTVTAEPGRPIPALHDGPGTMETLALSVSTNATIIDLDVLLDIEHSNVVDLRISLTSPTGQTIVLKDIWDVLWRDPKANMLATIFDDEATGFLTEASSPYSGSFRPPAGQELAHFDGANAAGLWLLDIFDGYDGDSGNLTRCELRFSVVHTPEPVALPLLALLGWVSRRRQAIA